MTAVARQNDTGSTVEAVNAKDTISEAKLRRIALTLTLSVAIAGAAGAEFFARSITAAAQEEKSAPVRPDNIVVVSKTPSNLPRRPVGAHSLFLTGNSHTYALPGLKKGDPLRNDHGNTMIDQLAKEVIEGHDARRTTTFYRISNPNVLPFESLTHLSYLIDKGYVPDVAIIGFTFRNAARDTAPRHEIHRAYSDARFGGALKQELASKEIDADPRVLAAIDAEMRQAAFEDREDQQRSDADRLDGTLMAETGKRVTLIGQSAELRARIFRSFAYGLDDLMGKRTSTYSYDVIDADLAFNMACERALVKLLEKRGVATIIYLAPERSDLPPMISPEREARETAAFTEFATREGVTVIDAHGVVPNEYWGFERETPDRSHFTEPGHALLAKFIAHHPDVEAKLTRLDAPSRSTGRLDAPSRSTGGLDQP